MKVDHYLTAQTIALKLDTWETMVEMVVRAVGYDWKICIIQFVKGSWVYGELKGLKRLEPNVELHVIGEGFVGILDDKKDLTEHQSAAQNGLKLASKKMVPP